MFLHPLGGHGGIGTTAPRAKLHVNGSEVIKNVMGSSVPSTGMYSPQLEITNGQGNNGGQQLAIGVMDNGMGLIQAFEGNVGYNNILINPAAGYGDIGTTNPQNALTIVGNSNVSWMLITNHVNTHGKIT